MLAPPSGSNLDPKNYISETLQIQPTTTMPQEDESDNKYFALFPVEQQSSPQNFTQN